MTTADWKARLAAEAQITKAAAGRIMDFITHTVLAELALDGRSVLPGLGIFRLVDQAPREFANPQNREEKVMKPAGKRIKFKAAAEAKAKFN